MNRDISLVLHNLGVLATYFSNLKRAFDAFGLNECELVDFLDFIKRYDSDLKELYKNYISSHEIKVLYFIKNVELNNILFDYIKDKKYEKLEMYKSKTLDYLIEFIKENRYKQFSFYSTKLGLYSYASKFCVIVVRNSAQLITNMLVVATNLDGIRIYKRFYKRYSDFSLIEFKTRQEVLNYYKDRLAIQIKNSIYTKDFALFFMEFEEIQK